MPEVAVKERWTVQLPSLDNLEELDSFCEYLTAHTDKRGVKRLLSQLQKHRKHVNLVTAFAKRAQKTAGYINGIRVRSDGNNNLKKTAQRFYESLNTPGLRMQCDLFHVDYESYDDQESIIAVLVEKHLHTMSGNHSEG